MAFLFAIVQAWSQVGEVYQMCSQFFEEQAMANANKLLV
jgi:hypothetical protein